MRADSGRTNPAQHDRPALVPADNPCPATGLPTGACPGYQVDHVIPLACHGPDEMGNMQWQAIADAKAKDRVERAGCR